MPYDFTTDGYSKFSEDIIAAGGDQATLTSLLADMQSTFTDNIAKGITDAKTLADTTAENDRLRKANMELFLRVGAKAAEKSGIKPEPEPEPEKQDTADYMKQYFARLDSGRK